MSQQGLRHRAFKGMQWTMGGRLLKSGLGIVTLAIVSRYLSPAEFGMVALVMFITGFAQLFVDAGLRTALVQRKDITELQKNTVFWSSILLSLLIAGLMQIFAAPVAAAFGAEAVAPLVRWTALIFPLAALQTVSLTTLERRFDFARIALSDFASALAGAATAITLVVAGFGMAGLIAQQLVQALVSTLMINATARWRPRARFSTAEFRTLAAYGGYVMLSNLVNFLTVNLSRPIVVGLLSAQVLGYYTMAQQVVAAPFRIIVQMARKVLFPILASVQHDRARVGAAYLDVQFAIMSVMAPICLGVSAVAAPVVAVLLGAGWAPVAPLIQLVAIQLMLSPIQETNQTVLASMGYARFQFWWGLVLGSLSVAALWLGAHWSMEAALVGRIAVALFSTPALSTFLMRQVGLHWSSLPKVLFAPVTAAVTMHAVVSLVTARLPQSPVLLLAAGIPLGVAVYVPLLFALNRGRAMGLVRLLRRRRA